MNLEDPATDGGPRQPIQFLLFVAGSTPRTRRAVDNLRRLTEDLGDPCEVEIIDVIADPARADDERILATPTLIKTSPLPRRRITGDLSDAAKVMGVIGV